MDILFPIVLKCSFYETTIESCHGKIPDVFQKLWFNPIIEFELPDAKATDEEFQDWLNLYRHSSKWFGHHLLDESQCN